MSEAVEKALSSGEWKEKSDPKSGRKFFVHSHTKRSVWNLQKELAKQTQEKEGKKTMDGLQADEIAAAEERAKITLEERQAKAQARVQRLLARRRKQRGERKRGRT